MAKLGYIRVSTAEQNEARQVERMRENGIADEDMFIEKITGVASWTARPKLEECIKYARKGDTLYVESVTRLGRSLRGLLDIIEVLKQKQVELVSFKENIDTNTANGRLMFNMYMSLSEWERDMAKERQAEGIAIAKLNGKYKGRVEKKIENFIEVYKKWSEGKITASEASRQLNISRSTFYRKIEQANSMII